MRPKTSYSMRKMVPTAASQDDRDRYSEATADMASHIGEKIIGVLRHPDNQARMQSLLDPIVSHIIQRVFPYILLSAILFLILLVLTMGTFWVVIRGGGSGIGNTALGTVKLIGTAVAAAAGSGQ